MKTKLSDIVNVTIQLKGIEPPARNPELEHIEQVLSDSIFKLLKDKNRVVSSEEAETAVLEFIDKNFNCTDFKSKVTSSII